MNPYPNSLCGKLSKWTVVSTFHEQINNQNIPIWIRLQSWIDQMGKKKQVQWLFQLKRAGS